MFRWNYAPVSTLRATLLRTHASIPDGRMAPKRPGVPRELQAALPFLRRDQLRAALGQSEASKKVDLARELMAKDRPAFDRLVLFSQMTRERSIFLYRLNPELGPRAAAALGRLRAPNKVRDPATDIVVECLGVFPEPSLGRTRIDVRIHSEVKHRAGSHPTTLERQELRWRNRNNAHLVWHPSDCVIEVRAKSAQKAETARRLFGTLVFEREDALVPILIDVRHFAENPGDVRYRTARFVGLNYHGTEEIELRGTDVQSTVERLRTVRDLSPLFEREEAVSLDDSILPSEQVRVYSNGKISVLRSVEEPYEDILRAAIKRSE
jgi:hypothetical protein